MASPRLRSSRSRSKERDARNIPVVGRIPGHECESRLQSRGRIYEVHRPVADALSVKAKEVSQSRASTRHAQRKREKRRHGQESFEARSEIHGRCSFDAFVYLNVRNHAYRDA